MWDELTLKSILEQVQSGKTEPDEAVQQLRKTSSPPPVSAFLEEATIDLDRKRRCGYSEVIYAEGKSVETVLEIFQSLTEHGQDVLATRVDERQAAALTERHPEAVHHLQGRTVRLNQLDRSRNAKVAIIAAGTTDLPVAWEAVETLRWMHIPTELITDVGVAGPHRLPGQIDRFHDADAIVVIAGMEGALASVVGGYVRCPVIAVPTSVGYGANFDGLAALLSMMTCCASNVTVVNIDSGFKGAYVAGTIAGRMAELREQNS